MDFESYRQFYNADDGDGITLRPSGTSDGKPATATFTFDARDIAPDARIRLFATGETALHYLWKDEPDYPAQYRKPEDAFDTVHAFKAQYCLDLSNRAPIDYIKRVYKKVTWPPVLSYLPLHTVDADWEAGLYARADGLQVAPDGYIRMRIETRLQREGVHKNSVAGEPNAVAYIDIPAGTYDWTQLKLPVDIPLDTAHVAILIEGFGYTGELYVERPYLTSSSGYNVLPDFASATPDKEWFEWTAQNLSRKEWPEVRVTLNGERVYEGEVFERCHRCSEWEIDLPRGAVLDGKNELGITLTSRYHDPMPYTIRELGLITQPGAALDIIVCPTSAPANGVAAILVRTSAPGATLTFASESGLTPIDELTYPEAGLNVVRLRCGAPMLSARFTLGIAGNDDATVSGAIPRIIDKQCDHVITGTGDLIYVRQSLADTAEYLSWYLSNEIGNLLTIRPTYRWSGSRTVNPEVWKLVTRVLGGMGVEYAHMLDGRELPGKDSNPSVEMLAGDNFLGRQTHERDGAQFYWGRHCSNGSRTIEQYADMEQRIYREQPDYTSPDCDSLNYMYDGNDMFEYRPRNVPRDMRQAADAAVRILSATRHGTPRHTGPSVMFKYFFDAGYDWVGAETMYGSMEPLMSFLRGACASRGQSEMGVHHAVQWSSSPHDTPERFRRYRLALYVSYMQGATQINTEEGLWHMEEYYAHFHRFSEGCKGHQLQQRDFNRYVTTHSRTGRFYTPFALLHGRLDGWHAFGHNNPWGMFGENDCDAEKSWNLLRAIYPLSKPGDALYIHGCPNEAVGYHTGTPHGNVDAIPVESGETLFGAYKALAFAGYNCADPGDFDRLTAYVKQGGALILGWPHMITNTDRDEIADYKRHTYLDCELTRVACAQPEFVRETYGGNVLHVASNVSTDGDVLVRTDNGAPLLIRYRLGEGSVYWVNAREYPGHEAVRPLYETVYRRTADELRAQEPCDVVCGNDVQYVQYAQDDGARHIYVLAVDWYAEPEHMRHATLRAGTETYPVELPFGVMLKAVVSGNHAAWALSEDGEVLSVSEHGARVQGVGKVGFMIDGTRVEVDFSADPVQTIAG